MIDAAKVARSGWRRVLRVKGKRIAVDERVRNGTVELIGLHKSEPFAALARKTTLVIQVECRRQNRIPGVDSAEIVPVVGEFVGFATDSPEKLNDWVIEVELHADLRVGRSLHVRLGLGDENLIVRGRKAIALDRVQVHVRRLEVRRKIVGSQAASSCAVLDRDVVRRDDDASVKLLKVDLQHDTMELQGRQSECLARMLREPERKGYPKCSLLTRVTDKLTAGKALANHLREAFSGLSGELLPHEEEVVVQGVDGRPTDDDTRALHEELADVVRPVRPNAVRKKLSVVADRIGDVVAAGGAVVHRLAASVLTAAAILVARPARLGVLPAVVVDLATVFGELLAPSVKVRQVGLTIGELRRLARVRGGGELARDDVRLAATGDAIVTDVRACRDPWKLDDDVKEVNEVAVAVQSDLRLSAKGYRRVKRLRNRLHGKVCVFVVPDLPESETSVRAEVLIERALSNELGERTRAVGSHHATDHVCCMRVFCFYIVKEKIAFVGRHIFLLR